MVADAFRTIRAELDRVVRVDDWDEPAGRSVDAVRMEKQCLLLPNIPFQAQRAGFVSFLYREALLVRSEPAFTFLIKN